MNRKRWLLLFSIIVLVALAVLASSLHDVHFQPGRSVSVQNTSEMPLISFPTESFISVPLWKVILVWSAFLFITILLIYLMPPDVRKRVIRQAISFALTVLALYIAFRYKMIHLPLLETGKAPPPTSVDTGMGAATPADAFQPPVMTPWVTYLISLGVMLAILILAWIGYRYWMRSRSRQYSHLNDLAAIARSSLDDLASGRDWGDVIIQSYMRMGEAVSEKRGLYRADAMTPREFAERLEHAGLPADAVKRLTRLFESVRYGAHSSSQADINDAVACLNSILQACGAT